MKENNSGITLIALVITIILLVILASIGINSGISTIRSAQLTKFTTEMKIMQLEVNELYNYYTNNESITVNGTEYKGSGNDIDSGNGIQDIGKEISQAPQDKREEAFSSEGSGITDTTGYKYYDQEIIKALEIEEVEGEFFVNIEKRSVISVDGIEYEGEKYYTLEQLPDGLYNVEYKTR